MDKIRFPVSVYAMETVCRPAAFSSRPCPQDSDGIRLGLMMMFSQKVHHRFQHEPAATFGIGVPLRISENVLITPELETTEDDSGSFSHVRTNPDNVFVQSIQWGHYQDRVVNRRTNRNPGLGPQATSQAKHFRPVGLHIEIADGIYLREFPETMAPAENCPLFVAEQVPIDPIIRPVPKVAINLVMKPEKLPADDVGLINLFGK